jgi:hypothetical protein
MQAGESKYKDTLLWYVFAKAAANFFVWVRISCMVIHGDFMLTCILLGWFAYCCCSIPCLLYMLTCYHGWMVAVCITQVGWFIEITQSLESQYRTGHLQHSQVHTKCGMCMHGSCSFDQQQVLFILCDSWTKAALDHSASVMTADNAASLLYIYIYICCHSLLCELAVTELVVPHYCMFLSSSEQQQQKLIFWWCSEGFVYENSCMTACSC